MSDDLVAAYLYAFFPDLTRDGAKRQHGYLFGSSGEGLCFDDLKEGTIVLPAKAGKRGCLTNPKEFHLNRTVSAIELEQVWTASIDVVVLRYGGKPSAAALHSMCSNDV